MASDEIRKRWGTIFMGNREASVEQLSAMQEPLRRDQQKKEEAEDYMERVKAKAADRAREILGAAYTERQNVLQEAKNEIAVLKRQAAEECAKIRAEGEAARKLAQAELDKAAQERETAENIRLAAHDEGFQDGMKKAADELHEFRAELGQSLAVLLGAIERQCKHIMDTWREDLVTLTQCAVQAGTGFILQKEHENILRNLVFQSLDLLENRNIVTIRVNPDDESHVADMFRAARERAPELKQWIVTGDANIESGGLIAESGSGSVDLQRQNFRELVNDILMHLGLPETAESGEASAVRELVEREVAHIASLTPELDHQEEIAEPQPEPEEISSEDTLPEPENIEENSQASITNIESEEEADIPVQEDELPINMPVQEAKPNQAEQPASEPTSLEELEEELFPLEEENIQQKQPGPPPDPQALQEGGFL